MKQFMGFIVKIKSFWKFYRDYGYDGEDSGFIISNYERVLCNRTKTMSKPTYFLEDVLRELDNWYDDRIAEQYVRILRWKRKKNMDVISGGGYIKIQKDKYSPSGYSLVADNSGGEYGKVGCPIRNCPICGRSFAESEG